jgi:FkbM family methyltransferase
MKAKIVYASSRAHDAIWEGLNLFDINKKDNFIFSTSSDDQDPSVIIELTFPDSFSPDETLSLDVYNRNLISCAERVLGMSIFTSINMRDWRKHEIILNDDFVYLHNPLKIDLHQGERFILFSNNQSSDYFHLGGICISRSCSYYKRYAYEQGFYKFSNRFGYLSNAQRFQDIFALYNCGFEPQWFLEFGANDGISLSNSILLESLGWNGIIGEALNRLYLLAKYTRKCHVVEGALSEFSGLELEFYDQNLISSSVGYANLDQHGELRALGSLSKVKTIRIDEILSSYNSPKTIGFFSLDVEGAEVEVLKTFPFDRYFVKCAAIEHNHTLQEKVIDEIMEINGFEKVLTSFSAHDGFYINKKAQLIDWEQSDILSKRINPHIQELYAVIQKILGN